jgi:hypothetical protein
MSYGIFFHFSRFTIIIEYILNFYEGVGFGDLKIEESESEVLGTDSAALLLRI